MQATEIPDVNARPSRSDQGNPTSAPQISAKLMNRVNNLGKWRVDPSLVMFPEDTRDVHGGYAAVSRAVLTTTSSVERSSNEPEKAGDRRNSRDINFMDKDIAVKKLKVKNEKDRERVLGLALREAEFLVGLSHKNILKLEGFVEDLARDRVWLIFPWADKGNLKDFVASRDWEIPERVSLISDVAKGVKYLHDRKPPICHGDLKSTNILVNWGCRAVIADFGSARRLSTETNDMQADKSENGPQPALILETTLCATTKTITLTGNKYTLRWAAPELLMYDEPGLWSDIWALGWICYEVITNSIPFEHVKRDIIVMKHVIQGDLTSVSDHARMALFRALHTLMMECWNIDPRKRPTARDFEKSTNQMPRILPEPLRRASDRAFSKGRSGHLVIALGTVQMMQNDYINASSLFTEAIAIFTDMADGSGKASALWWLAEVHRLQKEYRKAFTYYSDALAIYTNIGDRKGRADTLTSLATVHQAQEAYGSALTCYSDALTLYTYIGDREGRAEVLRTLVTLPQPTGPENGIRVVPMTLDW